MSGDLSQVAMGGVVALLVIKEVFAFIKTRSDVDDKKLLKDLWDWHNVSDPETGAKIWYRQAGVETSMDKLADALAHMDQSMTLICSELKQTRREVSRMTLHCNNK